MKREFGTRVLLISIVGVACSLVRSQAPSRTIQVVSILQDSRTNFSGHTVITLEWDPPNQGVNGLTGYELNVTAQTEDGSPETICGDPRMLSYQLPKNATSFVLMAKNEGDLPQFGPYENACKYKITLKDLPASSSNPLRITIGTVIAPFVLSLPKAPAVNYTCVTVVDETTGFIESHLEWTFTHVNLSYIRAAIKMYRVGVSLNTDSIQTFPLNSYSSPQYGTLTSVLSDVFCVSKNTTLYNFTFTSTDNTLFGYLSLTNICPKTNSNHNITFLFQRNGTSLWWHPLPTPHTLKCVGKTSPRRPGVVPMKSITLLEEPPLKVEKVERVQQYRVTLGLSWAPPLAPYGANQYRVYIGDRAQGSSNITNPLIIKDIQGTSVTLQERIVTVEDKNQLCILVQVQAESDYLKSEWSKPRRIPLFSDFPNCTINSKESFPTFAIVIIVVMVVVILFVIVAIPTVLLYVNHRRKIRLQKLLDKGGSINDPYFQRHQRWLGRTLSNSEVIRKLVPLDDEWEIPPITIVTEKQLGEGCFGQVYKGFVRGPIPGSRTMKNSIHITVAIKYLKAKASSSERKDFVNEIDMMKTVAKGSNPHVVGLIGCVTVEEPLCLIIEYLKYGDLLNYLHCIKQEISLRKYERKVKRTEAHSPPAYEGNPYCGKIEPRERRPTEENEKSSPLPYEEPVSSGDHATETSGSPQPYLTPLAVVPEPYLDPVSAVTMSENSPYVNLGEVEPVNLISFAYQIASGMEYLSGLEIIHRDLACRNVLVGDGKALKIADFGLSRIVQEGDSYVKTTSGRLPFKWMALESINDREYTTQSDVWAFGVVLWEIATLGGFPYPSIPNEELREYLLQGNRLKNPENCSDEVYQIMRQCWSEHPAQRPKFSDMRATFESMLLETSAYIQFSSLTNMQPSEPPVEITTDLLEVEGTANPYIRAPSIRSVRPMKQDPPTTSTVEPNKRSNPVMLEVIAPASTPIDMELLGHDLNSQNSEPDQFSDMVPMMSTTELHSDLNDQPVVLSSLHVPSASDRYVISPVPD